jgi:hypothetical protein
MPLRRSLMPISTLVASAISPMMAQTPAG